MFCLAVNIAVFAQAPIPRLIEKNGRHALLVDGRPWFILGGQVHNSSGWPALLPQVWQSVKQLNANTLEIPVYWEQLEPEQGKFDFSVVDTILRQAREHHVRLVLLWFGTWKNGSNHYEPAWMKTDAARYPNITGKNGGQIDSPSPFSKAALDADIQAFTALMGHLKQTDRQRTVVMVQVENESGAWGSVRDYSPEGQRLFEGPVPAELLKPEILKALGRPAVSNGTWAAVFGDRADEYFHAWYVARYIGQVAAAGKTVYPLPLYVNAALRDPLTDPPATEYESGGPTDNVFPIWKTAAPAIDLLAPDIYLSGNDRVLKVLELYGRQNNALFVPEAGLIPANAKYLYEVPARGGIGFSPFGIDAGELDIDLAKNKEKLALYSAAYKAAQPMVRELAAWAFEGKIKSAVEGDDHAQQTINLGNWQVSVYFGGDGRANAAPVYGLSAGKLLIVQLGENKFLAMGSRCHIVFKPTGKNAGKAWEYIKVDEGRYQNGQFKAYRILNGDETDWGGPGFGDDPPVLQITLTTR